MARLQVAPQGRVLRLTLDDPERGNALDRPMVAGLREALRASPEAEILVLHGSGPVWSRALPVDTPAAGRRRSCAPRCPTWPR